MASPALTLAVDSDRTYTTAEAFAYCERLARSHYENFPVGSLLIPRDLRKHFYSIYAYSRVADDIADEGERPVAERIAMLDDWERQLADAFEGRGEHPIFIALAATVAEREIPIEPLRDLLKAFRMDARNQGFETLTDLLFYCHHSANPIGRLVLHLYGLRDEERRILSDRICTGLQLANFWQDISVDLPRGRVNLPRESFRAFGYAPDELRARAFNDRFRAMMVHHVEYAAAQLRQGYPLLGKIPDRRLRGELTLTWLGGMRILEKIRRLDYDILHRRPSLGVIDKVRLAASMIRHL